MIFLTIDYVDHLIHQFYADKVRNTLLVITTALVVAALLS
jgi:hypothetical protein